MSIFCPTPLQQIDPPASTDPKAYDILLMQKHYRFRNLAHLLGAADVSKAGDRIAGLAASDEITT